MASIPIRNLKDSLKQHLRVRAALHGRSMEDEAREILRLALAEDKPAQPDLALALRRRFAALGGVELAIPRRGLKLLPPDKRRSRLEATVHEMFAIDLADRLLPFDQAAAQAYAEIAAARRQAARPITPFDAQIAAIARSRGRWRCDPQRRGFEGCGISVINPWRV